MHAYDGGAAGPPYPLRVHQRRALDAVERAEAHGARRAWVVLPPGAGKTLVGLQTARRRGRTAVVLGPNTAVATQWLRGWRDLEATTASATNLIEAPFTALTYQALAIFDPDPDSAADHDTADHDTADHDTATTDTAPPTPPPQTRTRTPSASSTPSTQRQGPRRTAPGCR